MDTKDWNELIRLKESSDRRLPQMCTRDLERLTELLVKSWEGKGDPPLT